ncbi:MAG: hypothetical protein ACTSPV_10480 [Candidatus Hodarchaeales archaeon]
MSQEVFEGILCYCEFDSKLGSVVRAVYPENVLEEEELHRLASQSMPQFGQSDEQLTSGFSVFQISEEKIAISHYKFLRGSVRTLTGAYLVSISFVTEQITNPFRFKPFLELILTPLFRVVVDAKTLKQIYEAFTNNGIIDKELSVRGPPIRVKARIISENELPVYYYELEKDLGKI